MNAVGKQLHVIFGTGALGIAVMRELKRRGKQARLVNRSGRRHADWQVEVVRANAANSEQARRACEGATVVYHCAQPPYAQWPVKAPPIMRGIVEGAAAAGARLVYGDNLYAYGRAAMPLRETLPYNPVGPNTQTRARLATMVMEAHQQGLVQANIGRASDFYGALATNSTMGERVFPNALKGRPAKVIGNPDIAHSYTYIDDFARALVTLGEREEALGEVWHVPSGKAHTAREFVSLIFEQAKQRPRLSADPGWLLRALGLVSPMLRAVSEVLYQHENAWVMDTSKFEAAFGDISTGHEEAIRRTLAWYAGGLPRSPRGSKSARRTP